MEFSLILVLPLVLYGREIWSLTLREEHRLNILESRVMKTMFVPKTEEII
jgi:hypothetical protein